MLCKNCGFKLDDHDEFCSGCGAKVEKETEIKDVPTIDAKVNSKAKELAQIQGKSRKKALIAIATIISIALIVLVIVQVKNKQPEAKQNRTEEYLTQDNLEDQVAAARQHRTDIGGTGLNTITNAEISSFHLTQYALLVNALNNMQSSSAEGLPFWINDADLDGTPELLVNGCFAEESWRSSQMTADVDSSVMWGYTATGAAGDSEYSFGQKDNIIYFRDSYGSAGGGFSKLYKWDGESWAAFCEDSYKQQNGAEAPVHNYTWNNSEVSQQEYEANLNILSTAMPSSDATDLSNLFSVNVNGSAPELILDYEQYLQEYAEGYLGVAFADVDEDGKQEAVFFVCNATKKWWDALSFESSWGDESCLNFDDYGDSAVLAETTDTGITLSAMKLPNLSGPIDAVYSDNNKLIVEAADIGYRVFANGKPNTLNSPCLSYEIANLKTENSGGGVSGGYYEFTENDFDYSTIPENAYFGQWNFKGVAAEYDYCAPFYIDGKQMSHGIGMYIPGGNLDSGDVSSDEISFCGKDECDTLSFILGSDSEWSHYSDSGEFRIVVSCDDDEIYDSGYQDYTYTEEVELDVKGGKHISITLYERKGKTHTLNVVLGDITLSGKR